MFGREKVSTTIRLAAVTTLAVILTMAVGLGVAAAADPVVVNAKVSTEGNLTVVNISVTNNTSGPVKYDIAATVPESGKVTYAWPPTYKWAGNTLNWTNSRGVNAGRTAVGYQYKVEGAAGKIYVRVKYYGTSVGTAQTEWIAVGGAAAATAGTPVAATKAAAKAPVAVLDILPVPAAAANPNAYKAVLAGTGATVAMGTTGLENVSVGAPVVFKAGSSVADGPAKTFAWTLSGPAASKAALDKKDAEVVKFTPDVPGVYKVDVVVSNEKGSATMKSVQVRAGTYIGVTKGGCIACHSEETTEWAETRHSEIFKEEIDLGDSHYGEGCLRCHTTGYYLGAANNGFADVQAKIGWKFPSGEAIEAGKGKMWDTAVPAELKNVGNIQCENCHGPAAAHVESKAPMAASKDEGVCNICHDGGGHHTRGTELTFSKHDDADAQAWTYPTGPTRQACVRCHSGNGYVSFLANPTEQAAWDNSPQTAVCAVCHDPHSVENPKQLRIVGKPVEVVGITKDFGLSATCTECHNARNVGADAVKGSTPHYSTAAEMLADTGGVSYGQSIPNSPHGMLVGAAPVADPADPTAKLFGGNVPGGCVTCHMWPQPADANDPNHFSVGQHSFNVTSPTGYQYTASCKSCHGDLAGFNMGARGDYDGNGKVEGVQTEVAGMLTVLVKAIEASGIKPQEEHPYFDPIAKAKANDKQNNAIYNYLFVRGLHGSDGKSAAIHNFKRSVALLQASYKDLTGKDVPNATIMK